MVYLSWPAAAVAVVSAVVVAAAVAAAVSLPPAVSAAVLAVVVPVISPVAFAGSVGVNDHNKTSKHRGQIDMLLVFDMPSMCVLLCLL